MRSKILMLILTTVLLLTTPSLFADEVNEATVPLPELLRLYRETDEAKKKDPAPEPPVNATIHRLDLRGRLLDSAVDMTAAFEIVVLSEKQWVRVPLMPRDARTHLSALPELPNAAFVVEDGELSFLTRKRGTYKFEIGFLKEASVEATRRTVRLRRGAATLARCHLAFDDGLFRLASEDALEKPDGAMLFARDGQFSVIWERKGSEPKKKETVRAAIESVIPSAHASIVSTLEGTRITRLKYQLRFAGNKPIEVTLPDGTRAERAYLNGVSIPVEAEGNLVRMQVSPAREGDEAGVLELVLSETGGSYYLSGKLNLKLPRISWPVNRLYLDVHLPQVFNYGWSGGSLSPAEQIPAVRYTYDVPQPGKKLSFHQPLISSSAPDVSLDYDVDLEGHYFRP